MVLHINLSNQEQVSAASQRGLAPPLEHLSSPIRMTEMTEQNFVVPAVWSTVVSRVALTCPSLLQHQETRRDVSLL